MKRERNRLRIDGTRGSDYYRLNPSAVVAGGSIWEISDESDEVNGAMTLLMTVTIS